MSDLEKEIKKKNKQLRVNYTKMKIMQKFRSVVEPISNCIDSVSEKFRDIQYNIEKKKEKHQNEKNFQLGMQAKYEEFLKLYDPNKIGYREHYIKDDESIFVVHKESGPTVHRTKIADVGKGVVILEKFDSFQRKNGSTEYLYCYSTYNPVGSLSYEYDWTDFVRHTDGKFVRVPRGRCLTPTSSIDLWCSFKDWPNTNEESVETAMGDE